MSDWLMRVIKAEASRLIELAADDGELRADLRALAESILAATAPPSNELKAVEAGQSSAESGHTDTPHTDEPLRELTLGRLTLLKSDPHAPASAAPHHDAPASDLDELETRCRQKAAAARWAAERLRRGHEGYHSPVENGPSDPEMVAWAERMMDSFYFMQSADPSPIVDLAVVDNLGGCFEAVTESLALIRAGLDEHSAKPKGLERSLPLVAEAQSALRAACQLLGAGADPDQLEVFEWLKTMAARHHVYIKRFMRAEEVADPAGWYGVLSRIETTGGAGKQSRLPEAHARCLQNCLINLQDRPRSERDGSWLPLSKVVDEIVAGGIPPSNREIRELLLPVIDELPARDDYPDGFRLVLREIDRFLATRSAPTKTLIAQEPSVDVKEVARLLGGKSVVLIGGIRRREAQESLRRILNLKDLIWIETKEHQAIDAFEPLIARADVAVVLLAIRWSSHAFGDVKQLCDRHGKLLVRLPGGYNPNQVAAQILAQSSTQLNSDLDPAEASARLPARSAPGPGPG